MKKNIIIWAVFLVLCFSGMLFGAVKISTMTATDIARGTDLFEISQLVSGPTYTTRKESVAQLLTFMSSNITITAGQVTDLSIPSALFELTDDTTHRTVTDAEKSTWNGKQAALGFTPEDVASKSTNTNLGSSDTLYPSQKAVKGYVDAQMATAITATTASGTYVPFAIDGVVGWYSSWDQDFSANHFKPMVISSASGTCNNNELASFSTATSGQRLYLCESGAWQPQGGGGGGSMTWPGGDGFAIVSGGNSWGTTIKAGTFTDAKWCSYTTAGGLACTENAPAGAGTVTSVALAVPAWLSVSGSPITSEGTFTIVSASITQNYFLAAPNGSSGVMTPRAIVAADIPTLNQNTTGSAATLTTPRAIYGNNFDGSAGLTQIIASTYGGTGNGFTKFSGPASTEKTFTLPNASATLTYTVASGTSALGTGAIASGACATAVTTAATGVATTDVINWGFNGDPTGVTGYAPAATGMLTIIAYPTANNVNYKVCNNTAGSITPGAITLNWQVVR